MAGLATTLYFKERGATVLAISRKEYDIVKDPFHKLAELLNGVDVIINCAGVIKPMMASQSPEAVTLINGVFPRNLATLGRRNKIPVFHLSTDCVYSGKTGKYDENSFFDAQDLYGLSKNTGDIRDCMTLRTSIIGEERGQSRSLIAWALSQAGKPVKGFTNHLWNGITTLSFAKSVEVILEKKLYQPGIFHIHSPDTVTKAELLRIFSEVYSLDLKIEDVPGPEFCDRSLQSLHPLVRDLALPTIKEQVTELKNFFSKQP